MTGTEGGTTNIGIIESTLKVIKDNYEPRNIYLVESDGIAFSCEKAFRYLNLDFLCSKYDAKFLNLSREPSEKIEYDNCSILKSFNMPKIFTESNTILINLAKIKTHEVARFSCAIKNLFGLTDIFRFKYHPAIDDVLCDIYKIFTPDLNIVDGIWAINGHGPWDGDAVNLDTVVASDDALLADIECLKIIGWNINDVNYIKKLVDGIPKLDYKIDGESSNYKRFHWGKPSKIGLFKEKIAVMLIPLLRMGFPLCYYSKGSLKMVTYGDNGEFCKSIRSFPKKK